MYHMSTIVTPGIYEDLMREFMRNQHKVFVVSPANDATKIVEESDNHAVLNVKTGQLQKSSFIKKGIATLRVPSLFTKAIKKYFAKQKFDLIIYSTPPITLVKTITYFKKRDKAKTFLLLKDIFPQNAIDIGALKTGGVKGIIYKFFRKKERKLYNISDNIGCMSKANVDYVLANNPEISNNKMSIVPNSIEPVCVSLSEEERIAMRDKYGIPQDKIVFVYGGNLGKPQDIPFIIECLKSQKENEKAYFLIVGDGTEFDRLQSFIDSEKPKNVKLLKRLPREDFDRMLAACDVGLIFLDHRFTIPNYPSRLLSYMQAGLPVLACTDKNTDVGDDIVGGGFGWKCESDSVDKFSDKIGEICDSNLIDMGQQGIAYLNEHFTVADTYKTIINIIGENK